MNVACLYDLYFCAQKYNLPALRLAVVNQMISLISEKSALKTYEFAKQFKQQVLMSQIVDFVRENTVKIIQDESFEAIQRSTLNFLLNHEKLNASELELFQACLCWAKAKCARKSIVKPNLKELRNALRNELYLLRIPQMSNED